MSSVTATVARAAQARQPGSSGVLYDIAALATKTVHAPAAADVRHAVRRCLIDWLGVAIAGWDEPPARKLRVALAIGDDASGFSAAFDSALPADHVALVLGTASHALDYDDTDHVNLIHVSSTLFPALFAMAVRESVNGAQLLDVFNAAYEAEDRIGAELGRKLTARGWHVSGVIGHLGSALACGLALDLEPAALAHAMAISSTASSGMIGAFGTMSKPLQLARGAANGLTAARLAREGFTGPLAALEGNPGFTYPLLGITISDWSSVARDWGRPYAVLRNSFKPHASCMITHPIIDAAIALRTSLAAEAMGPGVIASVTCRVNPLAPKVAGYPLPETGLEGKFSVAYCTVAGLVLGHATPGAFAPATIGRADIQSLLRRVDVVADPAIGEQQSRVELVLRDGRHVAHSVDIAKGNPANPLTDDELDHKFMLLAEPALAARATAVLAQLRAFERVTDVGAWLRTLNGTGVELLASVPSPARSPCPTPLS